MTESLYTLSTGTASPWISLPRAQLNPMDAERGSARCQLIDFHAFIVLLLILCPTPSPTPMKNVGSQGKGLHSVFLCKLWDPATQDQWNA